MWVESRTNNIASSMLALLALTGCSSGGTESGIPSVEPARAVNAGDDAAALCRTVAGSPAAVIGVTPSTVGSIRSFHSGPPTSTPRYPLASIWPGTPARQTAAWCQVKSGSWFRFLAVTRDRVPIDMAATDKPLPGGGYPPSLV
jgi:hypothetical protein